MCGINGILRLSETAPAIDRGELLRTREAMRTRGPDGAGEWWSPDRRMALAHRRLAILDLTPAGAQPMASPDGRFHIALNGEIYNFRALRAELESREYSFRSQSDTEVLLALYARESIGMLPRLRGMYALAIWDEVEKRLLLARDPLGIKPLYYAAGGGLLRFASQVRALEAGGGISLEVDAGGVAGFLLWGSVPEPRTMRRAVRAVPAGHYLLVEDGRPGEPRAHYHFRPHRGGGPRDAAAALTDSVRAHLVSDVPVAVFLSAGLDSSLIAALAARELADPPVTFTLSFDVLAGTRLDEAPLAAETARLLGTRHVERRVGRSDFSDLWPTALAAMDQPSIDGFNTFVVSRVARQAGLKVVLSGLGGDELFGSYPSFSQVPRWVRIARLGRRLPGLVRAWPGLAHRLAPRRPKLAGLPRYGQTLAGAYFLRRGLFLPEELPALLGRELATEGLAAHDPVAYAAKALEVGMGDPGPGAADGDRGRCAASGWSAVHRLETALYMRNQLLRDADWAGMAHSLEIRVPLVDHHLRERLALCRLPPLRNGGKADLVREVVPELPPALFRRPKTGFYIPVTEWLDPTAATSPRRYGQGSRRLARRVVREFGVEVRGR